MPSIRKNIASLYTLQLVSYVIPLVTLPWLTRVLGPGEFGRLGFCIAFNSYFVLLANYGFNFSATGDVAAHRDNHDRVSKIFWVTFWAKLLLAGLGLAVLLLVAGFVDGLAQERPLLLIGFLAVVGGVLTPTWYLQGMERLETLSAISIVVRLFTIPATFLLVRTSADVNAAMAINSGASVIIGILCLLLLLAKESTLAYVSVTWADLGRAFKDGWHLFVSTGAMNLYTATNTVVLGLVAGSVAVGYYSAAEKVVNAVQGLMSPITQSAYPRISHLMKTAPDQALAFIRRLLRLQSVLALLLSLALLALAPQIVGALYGGNFGPSILVLRWLAFLPLTIALSNVFGIQTMLPLGMKQAFTAILVGSGAVNLLSLLLLARWFGAAGAAAAVLATECLVAGLMAWYLLSKRIPIFGAPDRAAEAS